MALKKQHTDERLTQFPGSDIVAILDTDWCAFPVSSVGDELYIEVTHTASGKVKEFKNVTEFRGRGKKIGGWLGELNAEREEADKPPFKPDSFTIEHKQRRKVEYRVKEVSAGHYEKNKDSYELLDSTEDTEVGNVVVRQQLTEEEALVNIKHSAKSVIAKALRELGTHKYESYIGYGGRMREDISTLMQYKGNRKNTLKPLVMDDVVEYLTDSFNSQPVYHIENDDKVVMRAYGDSNAVVVGVDKDFYGQPCKFFNADRPEEGIVDCDCFGELREYSSSKSKAIGHGRIFLYWQLLAGDTSDNYKANCFSDVKYAGAGAFKDLKDCKDDKEALERVIEVFKRLYPEPKVVTGWRGNDFLIDWLYVAREQFKMAAMLRYEGDARTLDTEFEEYGVEYEY